MSDRFPGSGRNLGMSRCAAALCCLLLPAIGTSVLGQPTDAPPAGPSAEAPRPQAQIATLPGTLDERQAKAQRLALSLSALAPLTRDERTGEPLRIEVFAIYPARPTDVPKDKVCAAPDCWRVDIYDFARNATYSAIVDTAKEAVVRLVRQTGAQAELPDHLTQRALDIATKDPQVIAALGFRPEAAAAKMANTKTALNDSSCERSRHLCVAPTFLLEDGALWAIVDLTDERLVGVYWTDLGEVRGGAVTEESIKSQDAYKHFCKAPTHLERDGWAFDYILTSSDGLQLSDLSYQGRPVLRSAKLVDWHVSYSSRNGFGYSDAVGCPMFSSATVLAYGGPEIVPLRQGGEPTGTVIGFALVQDFRHMVWPQPCNYRYEQRYEFYLDGRFRAVAANLGRGCGVDATYRPVLRLALAPGSGQTLSQWDGSAWRDWQTEGWVLQDAAMDAAPGGYSLRVQDQAGKGYLIAPGQGQFGDGGRGDNAYIYATRYHPDEGDADMVTIGPCCNTTHEQGPDKFIGPDPEPIAGAELVLWYVPQLKNDGAPGKEYCWADNEVRDGVYVPKGWPCYAGPMFVPIGEES